MFKKATLLLILFVSLLVFTAGSSAAQPPELDWETSEAASGIASPVDTYLLIENDTFWHLEEDFRKADQLYGSLFDLLHDVPLNGKSLLDAIVEGSPPEMSDEETLQNLKAMPESHLLDLAQIYYGEPGLTIYKTELEDLTDQIWAVQVEADPGETGSLSQDFEAAYGPFKDDDYYIGSGDDAWWFVDEDGEHTTDYDDVTGVDKGDYYVGNYFNINQFAATSAGTTKRYINISSPWSGAYLHEDMSVEGAAEIIDSFDMLNLEPGAATVPDFWELF